ncbi:MAG: hypothetical protein ACLGIJ_02110 [Candidatus Limnocylindria bacterium]
MPGRERMPGVRVVAEPAALDGARWAGDGVIVLRTAPDEALALGATGVEVADPHAIVEADAGFVGGPVDLERVMAHVEWGLPAERPALAQGSIAGVPAKLWLTDAGALLVVQAAWADELAERIGWRA